MKTRQKMDSIIGILLLGLASIASAQNNEINSVPYTISSPGVYHLGKSIVNNTDAKITITSSDVALDLGGHLLQTSSSTASVVVSGMGVPRPAYNVTIRNGRIVNNVSGCIVLSTGNACVVDNVVAISAALWTVSDTLGVNNRISNCVLNSGVQPPASPLQLGTLSLAGSSDLVEGNIITSTSPFWGPLDISESGGAISFAGNVIRNNVFHFNPQFLPRSEPFPPPSNSGPDIFIGNLYPGETPK
jgi:hypothetical protein